MSLEQWSRGTKKLPPLMVGDVVQVQNQTGPRASAWELSGQVVEDLGGEAYNIRMDGSNRVSRRKRQYLRKLTVRIDDIGKSMDNQNNVVDDTNGSSIRRSKRLRKRQKSSVAN